MRRKRHQATTARGGELSCFVARIKGVTQTDQNQTDFLRGPAGQLASSVT